MPLPQSSLNCFQLINWTTRGHDPKNPRRDGTALQYPQILCNMQKSQQCLEHNALHLRPIIERTSRNFLIYWYRLLKIYWTSVSIALKKLQLDSWTFIVLQWYRRQHIERKTFVVILHLRQQNKVPQCYTWFLR